MLLWYYNTCYYDIIIATCYYDIIIHDIILSNYLKWVLSKPDVQTKYLIKTLIQINIIKKKIIKIKIIKFKNY